MTSQEKSRLRGHKCLWCSKTLTTHTLVQIQTCYIHFLDFLKMKKWIILDTTQKKRFYR